MHLWLTAFYLKTGQELQISPYLLSFCLLASLSLSLSVCKIILGFFCFLLSLSFSFLFSCFLFSFFSFLFLLFFLGYSRGVVSIRATESASLANEVFLLSLLSSRAFFFFFFLFFQCLFVSVYIVNVLFVCMYVCTYV